MLRVGRRTASRSGTSLPGSPSRRPSRPTSARRCTLAALAALIDPPAGEPDLARLAHHAEAAGDVETPFSASPRRPPSGPLRSAPTARLPTSTRGRFVSATGCPGGTGRAAREPRLRVPHHRRERRGGRRGPGSGRPLPRDRRRPRRERRPAPAVGVPLVPRTGRGVLGRRAGVGRPARAARALPRARPRLRPARVPRPDGRRRRGGRPLGRARSRMGASAPDDLPMLVGVLAALGEAETLQGAEWSENLDRAAELAEEHGLVEALGWMPHLVAQDPDLEALVPRGEPCPGARQSSSQASTGSSSTGTTTSRTWRGPSSTRATGRPPRTLAEQVLRSRRASTTPTILALTVIGLLRARRGDPDPWSPLDEAQELAAMSGELPRLAPVAVARAEAAWLEGRHDSVAPFTEEAYALALERRALVRPRRARGLAPAGRAAREPATRTSRSRIRSASRGEPRARRFLVGGASGARSKPPSRSSDSDVGRSLHRALSAFQELDSRPAAAIVARRLRDRGARGLPRGPRAAHEAQPGRADAPRVRGPRPARAGADEPRDRRAALPLREDDRPPRGGDPSQARRPEPRRGGGGLGPSWTRSPANMGKGPAQAG